VEACVARRSLTGGPAGETVLAHVAAVRALLAAR